MKFIIELKYQYIPNGFINMYIQITPYSEFIKYIGDVEDENFELYGDLTCVVDQYDKISIRYLNLEDIEF